MNKNTLILLALPFGINDDLFNIVFLEAGIHVMSE